MRLADRVPSIARGAALALVAALSGCASTSGPIFPAMLTPIVWPKPPDRPRIRYIGQLVGESSLGRKPSGLAALRAVLEGPPPVIDFATPMAVAVEGSRVYVADPGCVAGPCVHVLDLETRDYYRIAEAGGAALRRPIDVAIHRGTLAVADAERAAVFVLDAAGHTQRVVGQGLLQRPAGVAWRADGAELWVLDAAAHGILVFDAAGSQKTQSGGRGSGEGRYNFPSGLCTVAALPQSSTITASVVAAVADSLNFRIQLLDSNARTQSMFGRKGDAAGDFSLPRDVAFDSEGHIYVLDSQFENVQIFDEQGRLLMAFGQEGRGAGQFGVPSGITIDEQDRIWIADTYNRRVQVFQYLRENGS